MFQFSGFASASLYIQEADNLLSKLGFPIRISTGQWMFAPHRSLTQLITSFFAGWCQGIPHVHLFTSLQFYELPRINSWIFKNISRSHGNSDDSLKSILVKELKSWVHLTGVSYFFLFLLFLFKAFLANHFKNQLLILYYFCSCQFSIDLLEVYTF